MKRRLVATISSKGQLTLPKAVREFLRLEQGDYVRFEPKQGAILLTKIVLVQEEFTTGEWKALGRLADEQGKRYKTGQAFLKDLDRL